MHKVRSRHVIWKSPATLTSFRVSAATVLCLPPYITCYRCMSPLSSRIAAYRASASSSVCSAILFSGSQARPCTCIKGNKRNEHIDRWLNGHPSWPKVVSQIFYTARHVSEGVLQLSVCILSVRLSTTPGTFLKGYCNCLSVYRQSDFLPSQARFWRGIAIVCLFISKKDPSWTKIVSQIFLPRQEPVS